MKISMPAAARMPAAPRQQTDSQHTRTSLPLDQLIIQWKDAASGQCDLRLNSQAALDQRMRALSSAAGAELTYLRAMSGTAHVLKLPDKQEAAEVEAIVQRLMARAGELGIDYIEPDYIQQAVRSPNDPRYAEQWHYQAPSGATYGIDAPTAWESTTGSSSSVVAVVDTGIRFDHVDLVGRALAGYDFVSDAQVANDGDNRDSDASDPGDWLTIAESQFGYFRGCPPTDSTWHGSHVAGILGAAGDNGVGVAGVNWKARIGRIRALGKCGGYTSDIVDGMRWAAGISVMAVPQVVGVVSLLFSLDSSLTPAQVRQLLQATATGFPAGSSCHSTRCGAGIVNAAAALNAVRKPTETIYLPLIFRSE